MEGYGDPAGEVSPEMKMDWEKHETERWNEILRLCEVAKTDPKAIQEIELLAQKALAMQEQEETEMEKEEGAEGTDGEDGEPEGEPAGIAVAVKPVVKGAHSTFQDKMLEHLKGKMNY